MHGIGLHPQFCVYFLSFCLRGSSYFSVFMFIEVLFLPTTNWLHKHIIKINGYFNCSPAVEMLAFDDVFVKRTSD